ncbi:tripartite tricarboxylate transporter TctB family protein [Halomonas sp. A29]|uniref:tripartite tricarboxylate transporter TctB family protein n=1 Tax=Halomonas sp. A29 TaxID=3102786 RepID=UPI00398B023C
MVKSLGDVLFHLVLIGMASFFLIQASQLPTSAAGGNLSPAFFPKSICILIICLLVFSLLKSSRSAIAAVRDVANLNLAQHWRSTTCWLLLLGLMVAYALSLERAGYIITTGVFLFLSVLVVTLMSNPDDEGRDRIGIRRVVFLAVFSALAATLIYLVFTKGFNIILPTLAWE